MTQDWPRKLHVHPLTTGDAADIAGWRYDGPWKIYDSGATFKTGAGYWAVAGTGGGPLVGFCCVGVEARVPGLAADDGIEDVGVGMRPGLTGSGNGRAFAAAVLDFARERTDKPRLRAVVQSWNTRSLRVCRSAGFAETGIHTCVQGGREVEYVVLIAA